MNGHTRRPEGLRERKTAMSTPPLSLGRPGEPMRCMHCHCPEDQARETACLPGSHHGFVTRRPGQSSAEAEATLIAMPPKPRCRLTGTDGNVFALLGRVTACLKKAGQAAQTQEVSIRILACGSYQDALHVFMEYVDIT
jgi:hypothetical protein